MPFPTPNNEAQRPKVAVVGGGISGLAAGNRLLELRPSLDVVLLEAADRLGGVLETLERDDYLIERSADNFITRLPWALDLCRRVGLEAELLPSDPKRRRALVVSRGRLVPVPAGFVLMAPRKLWPVVTSPILSSWGKLRLACEPLLRPRSASACGPDGGLDESVASFVRRRMGQETLERLVQPLLAGIYTADVERLSIAATMPEFLEFERTHGSVLRGMWAGQQQASNKNEESGARYSLFMAPQHGMSSLVQKVAARLPAGAIRLNTEVSRISTHGRKWQITTSGSSTGERFDGVVLATPAHVAARLLEDVDVELSRQLSAIEYAGSVVVSLVYRREQVRHPLDAFGFVVPQIERRRIVAASFASVKYPGRAPAGQVLIRIFIGGALQPELLECDDRTLVTLAQEELAELLGTSGAPLLVDVARWPRSMPQYHVGHLKRVAQIEQRAAQHHGLALAGNAFGGVGIPQCVHSGEQAAERIAASLATARST